MIKRKIGYLFMGIIIILSGCNVNKKSPTISKYKSEFFGPFNTHTVYMAYATSSEEFEEGASIVREELDRLNDLFTKYDDVEGINNIKTINDNAGIEPVVVDPVIIDLLEKAIYWNSAISTQVNIALGPVLGLWHEQREAGLFDPSSAKLPNITELVNANLCSDITKIQIDKENNTVFLPEKCMSLDVGSVAKGYASQIVADKLIEKNIDFSLSAGGNVIVHGKRATKLTGEEPELCNDYQCVQINSPDGEVFEGKDTLLRIIADDTSMVTSGDYERYYIVNGKRYSHLIDPTTLYPANYFRAVTIITPDSGYADFLSSVVFLSPFDKGKELVEALDDVEAIWVFEDGTIEMSSGITEDMYLIYE